MKGTSTSTSTWSCSSKQGDTDIDTDTTTCCSCSSTPSPSPSGLNNKSSSSLWSNLLTSIFDSHKKHTPPPPPPPPPFSTATNINNNNNNNNISSNGSRLNGWTWASSLKKAVTSGSMRRLHERVLGSTRTGISNSTSDVWLLGLCYQFSLSHEPTTATTLLADFEHDFSSRIIMTYRKGFEAIGNSNYTSDVNWGCMLRSSQMLIAQALLFHSLGRSWRKSSQKPPEQEYIDILQLFGDSEASPFSIHNLVRAGKAYDLAAGSWVGPYAVCRAWENLIRCKGESTDLRKHRLPMAIYVVSGDEDGERGGAPVLYIEEARRHILEYSRGRGDWSPILLLVPLVLGLEKINPRYIPLLRATFSFPQSLGILGGKPGASTYLVGVQDEVAFYLDPHEVQQVVSVSKENLEADTSSYHCKVIRHLSLDSLDPSLAIGFYCRGKDDFHEFCSRASKLADESSGAPLFTVADSHSMSRPVEDTDFAVDGEQLKANNSFEAVPMGDPEGCVGEDEWQLL